MLYINSFVVIQNASHLVTSSRTSLKHPPKASSDPSFPPPSGFEFPTFRRHGTWRRDRPHRSSMAVVCHLLGFNAVPSPSLSLSHSFRCLAEACALRATFTLQFFRFLGLGVLENCRPARQKTCQHGGGSTWWGLFLV